jgi:NAD(P) transhydrogenase subunit alpha
MSGISLVGSLVAAGADHNRLATFLGFVAVVCATMNVVGGFLITDRMLGMFKQAGSGKKEAGSASASDGRPNP